jgi:restriction system protein
MKETFKYKFDDLFNVLLSALHNLGGSGSISEIEDQVSSILNLSDEEINDIHRGNTTKVTYRLAWARNYLKRFGLVENSARAVWALTEKGLKTKKVDKEQVKRKVRTGIEIMEQPDTPTNPKGLKNLSDLDEQELIEFGWQERLIEELQKIEPSAFERLCQRLLRELGFQNVEVTGRANDGGIDGKGILRLGGVLSFHVLFQAKRYKQSVSPSIVRDFRGAMVGRADKGIIITTGTFTREAKREASRDGASPIDLLDGNDLAEKLKELKLGVDVELVEKVVIKHDWFKGI